jgi:hypothetical protein
VEVFWGHEGDPFDPITQIQKKTVEVNILKRGGERLQILDTQQLRQFTYQEFTLLAQLTGFKVRPSTAVALLVCFEPR